jgi:protein TonB
MILSTHKLIIALSLSGLVHGWLLYGSVDEVSSLQMPQSSTRTLQLEFVVPAKITGAEPKQSAIENTQAKLALKQKVATEQVALKQQDETDKHTQQTADESLADIGDAQYEQTEQLSRTVEMHESLLQRVYQAINQHKRYPYMARRLRQQGKVILNFVMHPDGQVTNVVIIESSRYSILDKAAEDAVVAISPFALAADYLDYEKTFDVAVDFRLN